MGFQISPRGRGSLGGAPLWCNFSSKFFGHLLINTCTFSFSAVAYLYYIVNLCPHSDSTLFNSLLEKIDQTLKSDTLMAV